MNKTIRAGSVVLGSVALVITGMTVPAHAADKDAGLYGDTDPTYTGVYNQSLAILGLTSVGVAPNKAAVTWLLKQQCADGSFESYRADTGKPCSPADPDNFTGPSTNATALAALALDEVGKTSQALKAAKWLSGVTAPAGNGQSGLPSTPGGTPDTNSSALGYLAVKQLLPKSSSTIRLQRFLFSMITPCGGERGGAAEYQVGSPGANNSASAQALFGLTASTPMDQSTSLKRNPKCGKSAESKVGSYLASEMSASGVLSFYPFEGDNFGDTAAAILGFSQAGLGRKAVTDGTKALKTNARSWALKDSKANAGALGWLLMVSEATGSNEKKFGGVNLVTSVTKSQKK